MPVGLTLHVRYSVRYAVLQFVECTKWKWDDTLHALGPPWDLALGSMKTIWRHDNNKKQIRVSAYHYKTEVNSTHNCIWSTRSSHDANAKFCGHTFYIEKFRRTYLWKDTLDAGSRYRLQSSTIHFLGMTTLWSSERKRQGFQISVPFIAIL